MIFFKNLIIYNEIWSKKKYDQICFVQFKQNNEVEFNTISQKIQPFNSVSETVVSSLAYDWITEKVYIALEQTTNFLNYGQIEVCSIPLLNITISTNQIIKNKNLCTLLLYQGLDSLHYLVLDPIDGLFYN